MTRPRATPHRRMTPIRSGSGGRSLGADRTRRRPPEADHATDEIEIPDEERMRLTMRRRSGERQDEDLRTLVALTKPGNRALVAPATPRPAGSAVPPASTGNLTIFRHLFLSRASRMTFERRVALRRRVRRGPVRGGPSASAERRSPRLGQTRPSPSPRRCATRRARHRDLLDDLLAT